MSSFSFISGGGDASSASDHVDGDSGLFGGMDMKQPVDDEATTLSASGFGFISSSADDVAGIAASGFSFLSSGGGGDGGSREESETIGDGSSGFSFLTGADGGSASASSSFSFLTSRPADHPDPSAAAAGEIDLLSSPASNEIRLEKTATTRIVKKKKRGTKVGFGRDEEAGGAEEDADHHQQQQHSGDQPVEVNHDTQAPVQPATGATSSSLTAPTAEPITAAAVPPPIPEAPPASPVRIAPPAVPSAMPSPVVDSRPAASNPVQPQPPAVHEKSSFFSSLSFFRKAEPQHAQPHPTSQTSPAVTKAEATAKPEVVVRSEAHELSRVVRVENPPSVPAKSDAGDESALFDGLQTSKVPAPPAIPASPASPAPKISAVQQKATPVSKVVPAKPAGKDLKPASADSSKDLRFLGETFVKQITSTMRMMSEERRGLMDTVSEGMRQIEEADAGVQNARWRIKELEAEQLKLGEQDDYEGAAALSDPIEGLKRKVEADLLRIQELHEVVEKASSSIARSHKIQEANIEKAVADLEELRKQHDSEWRSFAKEWIQKFNEEDSRVRAEEERVQLEQKHVQREDESLSEEAAVINSHITGQTESLTVTKLSLEARLNTTLGEIAELELALAAKKAEEIELRDELKKTDTGITEVRRKYERQLQRIHDRKNAVAAARDECAKEVLTIHNQRSVLDVELAEFNASETASVQWSEISGKDVHHVAEFVNVMNEVLRMDSTSGPTLTSDSQTSELRVHVSEASTALAAATAELVAAESKVTILVLETQEITEKLPLLENEKKNHAALKRFKEAAAVAKDIKQFTVRKEEIDAELEACRLTIDVVKSTVQDREEALQNAKNVLKAAEKDSDLARFETLIAKARMLNKYNSVFISDPDFSRSTVLSVASSILDSELKSALSEADDLKEKHGLTRDLRPEVLFLPEDDLVEDEEDEEHDDDGHLVVVGIAEGVNETSAAVDVGAVVHDDDTVPPETADTVEELNAEAGVEIHELNAALSEEEEAELVASVKALHAEIGYLENLLQEAAEAEDYDQAAAYSDRVEEIKGKIDEAVRRLGRDLDSILGV